MKFRYEAMDARGYEVKDVVEAATESEAVDIIRSRNLYPTKITITTREEKIPAHDSPAWWNLTRLFRGDRKSEPEPEITFTKAEAIKALRRAMHGDNEELVEDFSGELDQTARRRDRDEELDRMIGEQP